jgi:DNA repair protein RadC
MQPTTHCNAPLHEIPVYEVELVQRRSLQLAEAVLPDTAHAGRTIHALLGQTDREHLAALFVNGRHHITGAHIVAVGGQHAISNIEARTVFRAAISACASAIILGHNHPSGDPTPSPEDMASTAELVQAGKIIGIEVFDHIIVTRDPREWYSMTARGTLPAF